MRYPTPVFRGTVLSPIPTPSGGAPNGAPEHGRPRSASEPALPDPEVAEKATRRRFTAGYKARIVQEADRCTEPGQIGALLRREGLYSSHLVDWRRQRDEGALAQLAPKKRGRKPKYDPQAVTIAKLQRENERLAERLRKAELIITAQKKIAALLGETLPVVE